MEMHNCSLTTAYQSVEIRMLFITTLSTVFKSKFDSIIHECLNKKPFFILLAKYFEKEIKDAFVIKGRKYNSIRDLENILQSLDYLSYPDFKVNIENYEEKFSESEYKDDAITKLRKT